MSTIDKTKEILQKLEPILGKKTNALWKLNLLSMNPREEFENNKLLGLIADKEGKVDFKKAIRLPPPNPHILAGKYRIGEVIYPEKEFADFGLRENEFIKHILIAGITGAGKTNLSFQLLGQFARHKKSFLVFDWKMNYRALGKLPEFQNLKIIRLGEKDCDFKFNPLIPPPGTNPKHWMAMLVDVIKHAFFVAHGVEYFFRKGIDHLYDQYKVYEGNTEYPTFIDLEKLLRKEFVRGREMLWMSSAKRTLACMTFSGLLGDILNSREPNRIEELLNKNVILEMDNLATIEKIFLIESLLLWIYHYRKNESKREVFKHAIIIEEAHHILSGQKELALGEETIMESVIRIIREFGESVIAIDQEPSKISNSILANTNCKICFNLGNGKDIDTMAKCLSLNSEEKSSIDQLKVGHAIVKMKERFTNPIQIKIPLIPIEKCL
ncbi:MAG: DUF87 domain-containing protein [Candidatus Zixiibacteriota bacterium]